MMAWLIESSIRLRLVVVATAALLVAVGVIQMRQRPLDALPEFQQPFVEIQTEALGLSAQEVEALVTTPMEADMINGTPWATSIRSVSIPSLSSIRLFFDRGIDIMRARQVVQERMTQLFALPQVSKPPRLVNPVSSAGRSLAIGLSSKKLSLIELSVLARWTIAPRLMGLPGVANVSIWGERQRQLQVQVNPETLRDKGVTLLQVIETAGNSLWASPLTYLEASTPGTGGWIETPNQRLGIRHILPIQTAADLAKVPIIDKPSARLGDVATLVEDHQPLIGDAFVNDAPSLMLIVEKFPWANSQDVTRVVEGTLTTMQPGLPGVDVDPTLFRPATFLEAATSNLMSTLLIGALLAFVAMCAFFLNWRTALITSATVVTAAAVALGVLYARGATINLIVVAGLVLAIAVLIDDAITDVESIRARLCDKPAGGNGSAAAAIICRALIKSRSPLLYATAIAILAAAPVLFLNGVLGDLLRPLVTSYVLALVASMVTAVMVTPALSFLLLHRTSQVGASSPVSTGLAALHRGLFGWVATEPRFAVGTVVALAVAGMLSVPFLRQESLLPDLKETDLVIRMAGSPEASHPAMSRITSLAVKELRGIPGVRNVSAQVGRAIMSDTRTNINNSEIWVSLDPKAAYESTIASIRNVVSGYPGLAPEVLTYHQVRLREELSGTGESLVVRVYGEDTKAIVAKAEEVQRKLAAINGVVSPIVQYPPEMPTLEIEVNIDKAQAFGLKPGDVRRAAASLVSGIVVGSLFEEQKVFDVVVWGAPEVRHSVNDVRNLLIDRPGGSPVRLQDVADVRVVSGESEIHRDAVARRIDVTASVDGRDLAAVAADISAAIATIDFPLEYRAELLGEYAERLDAQNRVIAFAIAAALGILLLLQAFVRSWRLSFALFLALPMALVGGIGVAMLTTGGVLSLGHMLGLLATLVITARNVVSLVARYRELQIAGEPFGAALVRRATEERAAMVLTSTIAVALMFVPFVIRGSIAGLEFLAPTAATLLGGLVSSTFVTLVGVPSLYLLFGAAGEPELFLEESPAEVGSGEVAAVA